MSETKNLNPSWLLRLLGFSGGVIKVSKQGVTFTLDGTSYFIDNHAFLKDGKVKQHMFTCSLVYRTSKGEIEFKGLPRAKAHDVHQWLQSYWYLEIFQEVDAQFRLLQKRLTQRYLRTSHWEGIINDAKTSLARFIEPPKEGLISEEKRKPFLRIHTYANYNINAIDKYRERYLKEQNKKYSSYFDTIESNPLTQEQRDACIIDEDNNLVLAGAGTGKTSTMIGRAGYLIKSKQAFASNILMVAFASKAANEMRERIQVKLGRDDLNIKTFHSLGLEIISVAEGVKPSLTPYAEDELLLRQDIAAWVEEFLEQEEYQSKAIEYFEEYLFVEKNAFDFESQGEYFTYLESDDIRTFKGEKVKGHGERIVANFLFRMGIEYEYEKKYEHETATMEHRQYKPDFYLPEHKIYIEHFGTDRSGGTAPFIDNAEYHEGMEWKRNIHKTRKTTLVETFFYEHIEGNLKSLLKERLSQHGVICTPIPNKALIETLKENKEITTFSELMFDILKRYRAICFDTDKLKKKIQNSPYPEHLSIALELLKPIRKRYESILSNNKDIDFEDMINKAISYVETGKFKPKWKYIMVDEFQDISDSRARLIELLKSKHTNCSLFCVGDDWQSIYRFTGSDISYTTGFAKHFGSTQVSKLQHTFRFNSSIADISSSFILKNKLQTNKTITSTTTPSPKVSLLRQSNQCNEPLGAKEFESLMVGNSDAHMSYIRGRYSQLNVVLSVIFKEKSNASVLILGRYRYTFEEVEIKPHKVKYPTLKLEVSTVHKSKGREADYVVVMGMQSGKNGFPSEKTTHPLLDALLPDAEDYEFAEERRLFYVAITRARYKAYLVSDMTMKSKFISELIDEDDYEIELNEFDITKSQEMSSELHCIKCETGTLQQKTNRASGKHFYGCSHWSLCDYTESGCESCGEVMIRVAEQNMREGGFRICAACNTWVAVCPDCKSDMKVRINKQSNEKFFGCKQYPLCAYTENSITPPSIINKSNKSKIKSVVDSRSVQFESFSLAAAYARELAMKEKIIPRVVKDDNGKTFTVLVKQRPKILP